jgi:hypothetical protein
MIAIGNYKGSKKPNGVHYLDQMLKVNVKEPQVTSHPMAMKTN